MEKAFREFLKTLKNNESAISQALGALVVVVVGVLLFNYFKSNTPAPEITPEAEVTVAVNENVELTTNDEGKYVPKNLPTTHIVEKSEHLWAISEKYYGNGYNWVDIAKENNLANANSLSAGMELTIPQVALRYDKEVKKTEDAVAEAPTSPETPEAPEAPTDSKGAEMTSLLEATSYTVVRGDHLWSIALRAYGDGYKWMDVYKANKDKIRNANYIEVGMTLVLPR